MRIGKDRPGLFSLSSDYVHVNKLSKNEIINVIQHDDRLLYLRSFYNGAFSIASKHDFDDQFFLLATTMAIKFFIYNRLVTYSFSNLLKV
jgi:hypothetical protein